MDAIGHTHHFGTQNCEEQKKISMQGDTKILANLVTFWYVYEFLVCYKSGKHFGE
jgi:hypothetical protein